MGAKPSRRLSRRGQRGLVRAGSRPHPLSAASPLVLDGLQRLGRALAEALDPPAVGRPALAGGRDAAVGGWPVPGIGPAASTETPDRAPSRSAGREAVSDSPGSGSPGSGSPGSDEDSGLGLLRAAQSGDAEAFGKLYDRYVDLVYRYAYYRVGDIALAEDLTSETFTRALRRIGSFSWQGTDFGAWLVTIARNLIADHYKSARFRMELSTADLLGAGADRPTAGPEGHVLDSLTTAAVLDAVRQLGPDQQECVVLRFLEGLSVAETARAMGKKPGAVKALQYRAVRSLGRLLPQGLET